MGAVLRDFSGIGARVVIVDDQHLFAEAIRSTLERHGATVVASVGDGAAALEAVRAETPDLVLLDLGLPDADGTDIGAQILAELPDTRVVALTAQAHPKVIQATMRAGFHGYVTKDTPLPQFILALEGALNGQVVVSQQVAGRVAGALTPEEELAELRAEQLTDREKEILAMLAQGSRSEQIAERLGISRNTVRTHIQNILTKLQVHSRLEAAAFAVRNGLTGIPHNGNGRPSVGSD